MLLVAKRVLEADTLPTLYGKDKTGRIKQWQASVSECADGIAIITVQHGLVDGKQQTTTRQVRQGKNMGRANETTPYTQALADARSLWEKKFDSQYRVSVAELEQLPTLPMLAHKFMDHEAKVTYPCYSQPKLNGVRCLAQLIDGAFKMRFWSRKGKDFTMFDHIEIPLLELFSRHPGVVLDGEIFHPELDFQDIIKRVKRQKTSRADIDDVLLEYHIYDCYHTDQPTMPYQSRLLFLLQAIDTDPGDGFVHTVPSRMVGNRDDVLKAHAEWVSRGYEGSMVRLLASPYEPDYRSYGLLKHKDFHDAEFPVVGAVQGQGKDEGTVVWVCATDRGIHFNVRPRGTHDQRSAWWTHRAEYIHQAELTVRYQNLSQDGVPIFPVGFALRNYE